MKSITSKIVKYEILLTICCLKRGECFFIIIETYYVSYSMLEIHLLVDWFSLLPQRKKNYNYKKFKLGTTSSKTSTAERCAK